MSKPTVAVVFGSRSAEHDVSIVTALSAVIKPLELSGQYEVVPVYISKDGGWYSHSDLKDITLFSSGKIDSFLENQKPVTVDLSEGLTLVQSGALSSKRTKIDIVFPSTHGTYGEDGSLMGLLEMANVPYVGCDLSSSVLAMDKVLAKVASSSQGVKLNNYEWFHAHEFEADRKQVLDKLRDLNYPLFVKPAHLGSSIAITRVTDETELENAIELAIHYDSKVLVEEAVQNLVEVTVPILGNDELTVGNTEEPVQGDAFFDFETKYMQQGKGKSGGAKADTTQGAQGYSHIPARLDDKLQSECKDTAEAVYQALGCTGIARVDLLVDTKAKQVYFNEVNPLPGSLYAHNWRSVGISGVELVQKLLKLAQERHAQQSSKKTVFDTNFLKQF